jgi:hypothetical protein
MSLENEILILKIFQIASSDESSITFEIYQRYQDWVLNSSVGTS